MASEKSTVAIYVKTRERLKELGKKSESYDDIINKLIRAHSQSNSNQDGDE